MNTNMGITSQLIKNLLRIMTPEEVGEITTTHNGGKFISLTDLANERVQKKIFRNFLLPVDLETDGDGAKILPFTTKQDEVVEEETVVDPLKNFDEKSVKASLNTLAQKMKNSKVVEKTEHVENENMSSFIMIEKARLKRSQQSLKQKEILELYQKNCDVDVEQIKGQDDNITQDRESGVLINKKHY